MKVFFILTFHSSLLKWSLLVVVVVVVIRNRSRRRGSSSTCNNGVGEVVGWLFGWLGKGGCSKVGSLQVQHECRVLLLFTQASLEHGCKLATSETLLIDDKRGKKFATGSKCSLTFPTTPSYYEYYYVMQRWKWEDIRLHLGNYEKHFLTHACQFCETIAAYHQISFPTSELRSTYGRMFSSSGVISDRKTTWNRLTLITTSNFPKTCQNLFAVFPLAVLLWLEKTANPPEDVQIMQSDWLEVQLSNRESDNVQSRKIYVCHLHKFVL